MWMPVSYWALILGIELLVLVGFYTSYKRLSISNVDVSHVERLRSKNIFIAVFITLAITAFVTQAVWLWFQRAVDDNFFKQHFFFIGLTVASMLIEIGYRWVSWKVEKLKQVSNESSLR